MATILIYLVIIGLVWYVVDRFILVPYTNNMIRTIFTIVVVIGIIIWLANAFGVAHIHTPAVK